MDEYQARAESLERLAKQLADDLASWTEYLSDEGYNPALKVELDTSITLLRVAKQVLKARR